jgi:hypothetical protein
MFMNSRVLSCFSLALLSSSLFLSTQSVAADNNEGIVVYNAQHENLVKSWVDGFTKETGLKSRCVMAMTASWVTSWFRKAAHHRQTCF